MGSGYKFRPRGTEGLAKEFKQIKRGVASLRGAAALKSAVIGEGGITVNGSGGITIKNGGGLAITDELTRVLRMSEDTFAMWTLDGTDPITGIIPPYILMDPGAIRVGGFNGYGRLLFDDANTRFQLLSTTGRISIEHFTTASAANAVLDSTTGVVSRSTSSSRYKQDIEDAVIDPADVLKVQGRTWRQRNDVEGMDPTGDTERRHVGFVAEELYEIPSMRQFVNLDEEGRPDSIETDRLSVALLELAKDQQKQIDALAERLDALEAKA